MANKRIEIEEMRISSNGNYFEFIFNCPDEYKFTEFLVQVVGKEDIYDLSEVAFTGDTRVIGSIPVTTFGVEKPEIYKITIKATKGSNELEEIAYISDVKDVYDCLLKDIKALDAKCVDEEIQNRVIRNYLILYAHQEALMHKEINDAIRWFNMMKNCFSGSCSNTQDSADCGCGNIVKHSSCGCGK